MLEQLWRERGIDAVLARCAEAKHKPRPIERALFERIADRALEPYSKLYCWDHPLREEVFLPSTALGDDARAALEALVLGREAGHPEQGGHGRTACRSGRWATRGAEDWHRRCNRSGGMSAHPSYSELDLPDLLAHLADEHGRVKQALPWLCTMAMKVAQVHGDRDPELFELDRLVRELTFTALPHIELEEERIFPALATGGEVPPRRVDDLVEMNHDHLAIGQLLEAIRVAASDFCVPEWACVTYRKLMTELRGLEAELLGCIHVESHEFLRRTLSPPALGPA